ncbi:MAG: hypothetical protein IPH49_03285 [Ignavibacteria bacterium]|nr:hypothetical protein [Ignavibacteria bacterium]
MRIALHTLGCKLNYSETATVRDELVQRGHVVVPFSEEADVLLVNTCSVTENADTECRKIIRRGLRTSPNASVVITGCYAQLQPEEIASIDGVKAVVGMTQKFNIGEKLDEIVSSASPRIYVDEISTATVFTGSRTGRGDSRTRSFFKIQDGCDYSCTFCTIPLARGPARAMSLSAIRQELESIAREGYHEVVLSGINLGEYRGENDERFIDVLKMIDDYEPPYRVRISSIEPNTLDRDHRSDSCIKDVCPASPCSAAKWFGGCATEHAPEIQPNKVPGDGSTRCLDDATCGSGDRRDRRIPGRNR